MAASDLGLLHEPDAIEHLWKGEWDHPHLVASLGDRAILLDPGRISVRYNITFIISKDRSCDCFCELALARCIH